MDLGLSLIHIFQVRDDDDLEKLKESIKMYGILTPLLVRPIKDGTYEIKMCIRDRVFKSGTL